MKKDVPIEIEVVEAAQPRPQRPGRSPLVLLGSGPSLYLIAPVACLSGPPAPGLVLGTGRGL